ncbi:hypothetical protein Tco_0402134 [Tanacetum coccineum]
MAKGLSGRMLMEHRDALGQGLERRIAGRSLTSEKVTLTDLFYLRGMDVGSVNIPYLLDRQPDVVAGASVDAGGAPDIDEGAQAVPTPAQAPGHHLLPDQLELWLRD